jgi:hypothetical protein
MLNEDNYDAPSATVNEWKALQRCTTTHSKANIILMSGKKVLRLDLRKLKKNYTITLNLAIIMGDLGYTPLSSQLAM